MTTDLDVPIVLPSTSQPNTSPFDASRRIDDDGTEYWSARELMPIMGYPRWKEFLQAVERARASAQALNLSSADLFRVNPEKSGGRPRGNIRLERFAAYLIAMNGDPRKQQVAAAQAYFALRTRQAETQTPAPVSYWDQQISHLRSLKGLLPAEEISRRASALADEVMGPLPAKYTTQPSASPQDPAEALVEQFWLEFKDRFTWTLVPFTFASDLLHAWSPQAGAMLGHRVIVRHLKTLADKDPRQSIAASKRTIRPGRVMNVEEPLIDEFGLDTWRDEGPAWSHASYRGMLRLY